MDALRWKLVNLGQALFLGFWSVLWMTSAIVVRLVTGDEEVPLAMARRFWAPPLLRAAAARLEVTGASRVDFTKPCVFVMNHESMIDIPAAFVALPVNLRFIIKREILSVPFLGWYCRAVGMIPVDRGDTAQAVQSLKRAGERIRGGANVLAFPEGTRSRDGAMLPFKKGVFVTAIEAGVPVVPMAIAGARESLPADGFRIRPATIRIAFGDPIATTGMTFDDRYRLTEAVHAAVSSLHRSIGGAGAVERAPAPRALAE